MNLNHRLVLLGLLFLTLVAFLSSAALPIAPAAHSAGLSSIPTENAQKQVSPTKLSAHNVEFLSHIGGSTNAVAIKGNLAYVGEGPRLTVLDVSDPAQPAALGKSEILPEQIDDIAVEGNYAYVVGRYTWGLRIFDISDPGNPHQIGYHYTPGQSRSVAVAGNFAYVADGIGGLRIFDIANPAAPTAAGFYDTDGYPKGVAVQGDYAYLTDGSNALLQIVDISDPFVPIGLGSFSSLWNEVYGIAVSGNYAYVAAANEGLRIFDISDPATPTDTGYADSGYAYDVALDGDYAYVSGDWRGGMRIINIADPNAASEAGVFISPQNTNGIAAAGDVVYLATTNYGLRTVDVSAPAAAAELGAYNTIADARDVDLSGMNAYVAGSNGLQIVDATDPTAPLLASIHPTSGYATAIDVTGQYAYAGLNSGGLPIIDIQDSLAPFEAGFFPMTDFSWDVKSDGQYAYVANYLRGLRIVDVTDPAASKEIGAYNTEGYAVGVAIDDGFAYVSDSNRGLIILEITNPAKPKKISSYNPADFYAFGVDVLWPYAYVVSNNGLQIIDISDRAHPTAAGLFTLAGSSDVKVEGDFAFITSRQHGLRIINISDPAHPVEVGSYQTLIEPFGIAVDGNLLYIADGHGGLSILRFTGLDPQPFMRTDPDQITLSAAPDTIQHSTITIQESGDLEGIDGVNLSATDLFATSGAVIDSATIGFLPNTFDLPAGASQLVDLEIALPDDLSSGIYSGSIVIGSLNAGTKTIALSVDIHLGSITIRKQSDPVTDSVFDFSSDLGSFSLQHGQQAIFMDLPADGYHFGEILGTDWELKAVTCSSLGANFLTNGVFINLNPGQDITCTFENEMLPPHAENMEFISHIGGPSFAVDVRDNLAYSGEGRRLTILDFGNPEQPVVVGKTELLPWPIWYVAVEGDHAFATDGVGLHIIDVTDPTSPSVTGYFDPPGTPNGVAVSGNFVYVADDDLYIVDIADPASPRRAGRFSTPGSARRVAVAENLAYIADYSQGLRIVDVSDPARPVEVGFLDTLWGVRDIALAGNLAYVADAYLGLRVIDISDPSAPIEIGSFNPPGTINEVERYGSTVYLVDKDNGLRLVNVADPAHPTEIRLFTSPVSPEDVTVNGEFAFVADGVRGLRIIDVLNPFNPVELSVYRTPANIFGTAVTDERLYVTATDGLYAVDVRDKTLPLVSGFFEATNAHKIAVSGMFAYFLDSEGDLLIVDLSNPADLILAGSYDIPGYALDLAVAENIVFIIDNNADLRILDASDKSSPIEIGFHDSPNQYLDITANGTLAFIAAGHDGLRVFDASDPHNPHEIGLYDPGDDFLEYVAIQGNQVYLANGAAETLILDVTDPTSPQQIGLFDKAYDSMAMDGNYAFGASWLGEEVRAFDISSPANTTAAGFYGMSQMGSPLAAQSNYAYLSLWDNGLVILRLSAQGSITIAKEADPADRTTFEFEGDLGRFSLKHGQNEQFTRLEAGSYTIRESELQGWALDSIECDSERITSTKDSVTIHLQAGADISCTFSNIQLSSEANAGGPYSGEEGTAVPLDASTSSNSEIIKRYKWDCISDGTFDAKSSKPTGSTCTYPDDGAYTVSLTTVDIFDRTSTATATATIENLPPVVDAGADQTVSPGTDVRFAGSFVDPGPADSHSIKWDFGDGSKHSGKLNPKHNYQQAGSYTVTLTVTDNDGGQGVDTLQVDVVYGVPAITGVKVIPAEVDEGGRFILSGTIDDGGSSRALTLLVNWGDGQTLTRKFAPGTKAFSFSHSCADDPPGAGEDNSYAINLQLSDSDGASSTSTAVIKVNNVPPRVDAGPDKKLYAGHPAAFTATVTDPGGLDVHTHTWDFGDGSPPITTKQAIHTFAQPGEYIVTISVEDDDGGLGQDSLKVTVSEVYQVYLPLILQYLK